MKITPIPAINPILYVGLKPKDQYNFRFHYFNQITELQDKILNYICDFYKKNKTDVIGLDRKRDLVIPRQVFCYFAKYFTRLSLKQIGYILSGRDHSTVIYSISTVNDLMDINPTFAEEINKIKSQLINLLA